MTDVIENYYGFFDSTILHESNLLSVTRVSNLSKISIDSEDSQCSYCSQSSESSQSSQSSQSSDCDDFAYFISLITTPKCKNSSIIYYDPEEEIDFNEILYYMKSSKFCKSINRLINNKHECVGFNITDIRLDVIDFLREHGHINMSRKAYTFNVLDILYTLFSEYDNNPKFWRRNYEYINYFWIWIENEDPKMLVDYINPQTSSYLIHAILQSYNEKIRYEFFNLFLEKWEYFYPMKECPVNANHTETIDGKIVDGENIILILARNFMGDELKKFFKHKKYSYSNYTWYQYYNINGSSYTVPLIMFLLEENSWMRRKEDLTKFAEIIDILIKYGKIDLTLKVIESGNNLHDYLNYYGYNYVNSPVMKVIMSYGQIEKETHIPLSIYQYNFDEDIPYDYIRYKYEFVKDITMGDKIFNEISEEEKKTGISYSKFISESGLINILF